MSRRRRLRRHRMPQIDPDQSSGSAGSRRPYCDRLQVSNNSVGGRLRDRACQIAGDHPTCAPTVIRPASRCSDPAPPTDRPPSNQRAHSTSFVCCRPLYRLAPNSDLPATLVSGRGRWRRSLRCQRCAGVRVLLEQRGSGHDLSRLAIAALGDAKIKPRRLYALSNAVSAYHFDGGDLLANRRGDWGYARARRHTVEMKRARAAERHPASELCTGHAEYVAQGPQKPRVIGHVDGQ
jgi:hypothetical protein